MTITWKDWVNAWVTSSASNDPMLLEPMLAENFQWPTSDMDREETLEWVKTTDFRASNVAETFYESDDLIVGTHEVMGEGHNNVVMGCAHIKDGKVALYQHLRKPS